MKKKGKRFILTKIILAAKKHDVMNIIVIRGAPGAGKTTYAVRTLRQLYGSWDAALEHFFTTLDEAEAFVRQHVQERETILAMVLDDITQDELNQYEWYSERAKRFVKFLVGARNVVKNMIFTDPGGQEGFLPAGVRRMENIRAWVKMKTPKWAYAKIYAMIIGPFHTYPKTIGIDIFKRKLPDDVYSRLQELRWKKSEDVTGIPEDEFGVKVIGRRIPREWLEMALQDLENQGITDVKELYTPKELADRVGKGKTTLYRLIRMNIIPYVKLPDGAYLIPDAAIQIILHGRYRKDL